MRNILVGPPMSFCAAGVFETMGRRPSFALREITVEPGDARAYDEAEWRDALVIVGRGEIELEARAGSRVRFRCGDILWLCGLPLLALRNPGPEPTILVAVSRRTGG